MLFVYQPEGAEPRSWDYAPSKLMNAEAEAIERRTGMTFTEWQDAILRGSITAQHALLWVMLKRDAPTTSYDSVQFNQSELSLELDDEESANLLSALEEFAASGAELSPNDLALLEKLRADAPPPAPEAAPAAPDAEPVESYGEEPDDAPKAVSTSDATTSG